MSWNEPGDKKEKGKREDPWERDEKGPPNIDEALRQFQQKLRSVFGNGGKGSDIHYKSSDSNKNKKFVLIIGIIAFIGYLVSGIFVIEPAEEAVILRFGRYVRTEAPGPHWLFPLIESRRVVNVQEVKTSQRGGPMLTKDENIVNAEIAVQFRISNARDYLFNVVQPEKSLEQVADSALRSVVGRSTLNEVLTSGRSEIGTEIRRQVQQNLNNYHSGLEISDVAVQQTKAPEEVKAAFDDAIKAQQDEERLVNEAEAYAHKVIPIAEGNAKRILQEAGAYKEQVILEAIGKTAKFTKILPEYKRSPQVMRERLFIDTMQQVYATTPKVLVDVTGSNNLVYLPLDRLMENQRNYQGSEVKEDENFSAADKSSPSMGLIPRRISERPNYDDAERVNRSGE